SEGLATARELARACDIAYDAYMDTGAGGDPAATAAYNLTRTARVTLASGYLLPFQSTIEAVGYVVMATQHCRPDPALPAFSLRDVIGNPFHPSSPLPRAVLSWNDGTIPRIARGIYDDRKMPEGMLDNARLAILADALLDAGCEDEGLMAHCRG